jgi:hypothetical protein
MDLYRLLDPPPHDCEGQKHVSDVLKCAVPRIDGDSESLYNDYKQKEDVVFFSMRGLRKHFSPETIQRLLKCACGRCHPSRGDGLRCKTRSDEVQALEDRVLLVSLMIHLGKLHFIYIWVTWGFTGDRLHDVISKLGDDTFLAELSMKKPQGRLFEKIYKHALEMFEPVVFKISEDGFIRLRKYLDTARFPFYEEETLH